MNAKEFYELNKGKYFMHNDEKVRVVGYNDCNIDALIVSISKGTGMAWTWIFTQEFVNRELVSDKDLFRYVFINELEYIGEKLNLCEILKGCEGVELWSDIFGKCKLSRIDPELTYPIKVEILKSNGKGCKQCFSKQGKWSVNYPEGKCMLWPSETCRDWSTFKRPIKEGMPCMCKNAVNGLWILRKYNNAIPFCYKHIVPATEFDFTDIESNKSKSII